MIRRQYDIAVDSQRHTIAPYTTDRHYEEEAIDILVEQLAIRIAELMRMIHDSKIGRE